MRICNGADKNFQQRLVVNIGALQKLVSQILLPYKNFCNNRNIILLTSNGGVFFFMNIIAKPHAKRLSKLCVSILVNFSKNTTKF